jgi:hypothetical protein
MPTWKRVTEVILGIVDIHFTETGVPNVAPVDIYEHFSFWEISNNPDTSNSHHLTLKVAD